MGQKISGGGRKVWLGRMRICICARHTPDTRGLRGRAGRELRPPSGLLPRGPCASSGSWAQAWIPHRATRFLHLCSNREMGLIRTLLPFAEAAVRKRGPVAITNSLREALLLRREPGRGWVVRGPLLPLVETGLGRALARAAGCAGGLAARCGNAHEGPGRLPGGGHTYAILAVETLWEK